MPGPTHLRPRTLAAVAAAVGALVAVVLGFLTFGAQATAAPDKIPVAVAAPGAGPMRAVAEQVSQHGGGELGWRVTSPEQGQKLLEDKEVYGVLELGPGPSATGGLVRSGEPIRHADRAAGAHRRGSGAFRGRRPGGQSARRGQAGDSASG